MSALLSGDKKPIIGREVRICVRHALNAVAVAMIHWMAVSVILAEVSAKYSTGPEVRRHYAAAHNNLISWNIG